MMFRNFSNALLDSETSWAMDTQAVST